jgi:hypothetical protein
MFKFEGNQELWVAETKEPVTVFGRTEFFTGKQPRYYVQGEEGFEAWLNEDALVDVDPNPEVVEVAPQVRGKKSLR